MRSDWHDICVSYRRELSVRKRATKHREVFVLERGLHPRGIDVIDASTVPGAAVQLQLRTALVLEQATNPFVAFPKCEDYREEESGLPIGCT